MTTHELSDKYAVHFNGRASPAPGIFASMKDRATAEVSPQHFIIQKLPEKYQKHGAVFRVPIVDLYFALGVALDITTILARDICEWLILPARLGAAFRDLDETGALD